MMNKDIQYIMIDNMSSEGVDFSVKLELSHNSSSNDMKGEVNVSKKPEVIVSTHAPAKADADLDSGDSDKEFFATWRESREVRIEEDMNEPKMADYDDGAFMRRFDDDSGDEAFLSSISDKKKPELTYITSSTNMEAEANNSDSDKSIDSNHLIHYKSSDEESQNERSASSSNSDTDYDKSDMKHDKESKNETPQIMVEEFLASFGISKDIRTEEGMNESIEKVSKKSEVITKAPEAQAKPLVSNNDSNSYNDNFNLDSNSGDEMPDDSDNGGHNRYGGYNEYGERDRGYYYRDGRYKRKVSPMMSPIISPVTA